MDVFISPRGGAHLRVPAAVGDPRRRSTMTGCPQGSGGRCVRRGRATLRRLSLQSLRGDPQLLVVRCAFRRGAGQKALDDPGGTTSLPS